MIYGMAASTGFLCLLLAACGQQGADSNDPDFILLNGKVITMDADDSIVDAVSIRGEKIVALGGTREIRAMAGPKTQIIDLDGKATTPGLIDTHNHFGWGALDERFSLNLSYPDVTRIGDVILKVAEGVSGSAQGDWIIGSGWDAGKLTENRNLTAADLDGVSPDNPVWLLHTSAHYGVANSNAMELAGVTAETPDPAGGLIGRDDNGEPNGIFVDQAMGLVSSIQPPVTAADFEQAIASNSRDLSAEGITTIKDPEIDERHWEAYANVMSRDGLTVRVFVLWRAPDTLQDAKLLLDGIAPFTNPRKSDERHLISGGVKIYIDGSGTVRTAWMHDEWNVDFSETDTGNYGLTYIGTDVLLDQIRLFHNAEIHMGIHSIGDRAIDFTMDAYDTVLTENPVFGLRHSVIHCNLPTEHAMDLMQTLQSSFDTGYPELQPAFLWWIGDAYTGNYGAERSLRVLPLRSFVDRGITWAASSDYDVSPFAPRYGIWASVARQTLMGTYGANPWGMDESISVRDALRSYTTWAARQVFMEDDIGSIELGKLADLVVWDRDPLTVPTDELKDMKALMTVMNGQVVHGSAGEL